MIIALAQTRPVRGDIPANIDGHVRLIEAAVARGAEVVAFPELSLTGYEPALAWELAVDVSDPRLEVFQRLSDARRVTLAIGLPTRATPRPRISLALFSPGASPWFYSKRYLHADEEPFFFPGDAGMSTLGTIALAICYEVSVPAHAEAAFDEGAQLYLASVAKTAAGVEKAHARLAEIARTYKAKVLMVNAVGMSGDGECAGGSAAWDRGGRCLARLDATREGLLLFDTVEERATVVGIPAE